MDADPASAPAPAAAVAEEPMIPVSEAPVNALFVPSTSTSASSGSSTIKPPAPKQGKKKNRRMKRYLPEPYSPAEVTYRDVRDFLGPEYIDEVLSKGDESEWLAPEGLELWSIIELTVGAFTVSGESFWM
jgi:tRNA (uracil-5-)-methyltransferase